MTAGVKTTTSHYFVAAVNEGMHFNSNFEPVMLNQKNIAGNCLHLQLFSGGQLSELRIMKRNRVTTCITGVAAQAYRVNAAALFAGW
ncbi:MAG TPA: hypothetical protein VJZ49_09785 [Syntrophales bacterium]|nr:hypothetical protein [Syntrophales bacterium]